MSRASSRYTQSRVDEILKVLTSEDRQIIEAHLEDKTTEARQARPAMWGSVGLLAFLGLATGAVSGWVWASRSGLLDRPPAECAACPTCPPPPETPHLEWSGISGHPMRFARVPNSNVTCYWPLHEDLYFCMVEDLPPEELPLPEPEVSHE